MKKTLLIIFTLPFLIFAAPTLKNTQNSYQEYLDKNNKKNDRYKLKDFIPLNNLINKYNKIKENQEKYNFILNIKNEVFKDYLELKYYQEIDNEISFQKKILSLKIYDIFLTLPFVINEFKINNYKNYQSLIKKIYSKYKNNLAILLFYESDFLENNLDLSLIEDKFLDDKYHLINVIEKAKTYEYKIAIKKILKLIKLHPRSKILFSRVITWNEFFRKDKDFVDLVKNYPFMRRSPLLLYHIIKLSVGEKTSKNLKNKIKKLRKIKNLIPQAKTLYKLFINYQKNHSNDFFKEELNSLSQRELNHENKILKKYQNTILDKNLNYNIEIKEAIRFANISRNDLAYEIIYIEKEEVVELKNVLIFKQDGEIIPIKVSDYLVPYEFDGLYSDMRIMRFNLKNHLSKGDVFYINYKVISTDKRNYFDKKISITENIKPASDIVKYKYTIQYPKNIKLKIAYNKNYLTKKIRRDKKNKIISFEASELKQYMHEDFYNFSYKEEPYISISNFSNWKEVKQWFKDIIFDESYVLTEKNKNYFKSLYLAYKFPKENSSLPLESWGDKESIIKFFYNYILDNIHYVGIELGIHSYKPYNPNIVFENKYGDCKDRAILFYNIMKLFDIDVKIVILSSNFEKYDFKIPSYSYFDHAIIYIPSIDRYLDLTDNKVSYPYLPKSDINSKVLVLKQNSSLKTLNFKENELIKKEFTYEKLNKDLKVYHKESYYGSTGLNHLKTDFKKLKNLIYERYVNKYYNELTNFISYKVNQETRVIPYILNLEYILKNKLSGNIITLFQESDLFETKFAKTRNRVNSFYFNTKPKYEYIFKFKNINNIYSFQDKEFKNTYFNSSLILKDNIIYFKFNMNVKYISANEYINFKNKLKELDKLLLTDYYLEFK